MFWPVDRSITVSAPQRWPTRIFSTSSSMEEVTAELPMLALIFTRKLRPMIIGSSSGWLMLAGMMAHLDVGAPVPGCARVGLAPQILANRDKLHLRRNDSPPRVVQLRHVAPRLGLQRPAQVGKTQLGQRRIGGASPTGLVLVKSASSSASPRSATHPPRTSGSPRVRSTR